MKLRKADPENETVMRLLVHMKEMTDNQRKRIRVVLERITDCEGGIPGKNWCEDCRNQWRKCWTIAEKFRASNIRAMSYHSKLERLSIFKPTKISKPGDDFKPYTRGDII